MAWAETALAEKTARVEEEASRRREETELLARKLAERTRSSETDRQAVIDVRAEMEVVKRQNQSRLRELTKELARRREEDPEVASIGSRCSSSRHSSPRPEVEEGKGGREEGEAKRRVDEQDTQQLLVEKVVKLQRSCARRQEKLEFLEEHVQ